MTTSTISALAAAGALAGTEPIETVQGGVSKKTTAAAIAGLAAPAGSGTELQYRNAGAFGAMGGTAWDNTNRALTITGATVTASNPIFNLSQTWNASGVTFTGWKINITSTASAAASLIADMQVGSVSQFNVDKSGNVTQLGVLTLPPGSVSAPSVVSSANSSYGIYFPASGYVTVAGGGSARFGLDNGKTSLTLYNGTPLLMDSAGNSGDVGLARNAAGVFEINNGTAGTFADLKLRNTISTGTQATSAAAPTITSASTIAPTTAIAFVSGTTAIVTITAPSPISTGGGTITLIPTGAWTTTAAGNIAIASTAVVSKALIMTYDTTTAKWYPSY